MPALFPSVDALVCMGGYNTLAEVAAHGVPTVCVPRVTPRSEQWIRARAFERLGILQALHPDVMNPAALREAIAAALQTPRRTVHARAAASLRFDGARRAAEELLELADSECKITEPCTVVAG